MSGRFGPGLTTVLRGAGIALAAMALGLAASPSGDALAHGPANNMGISAPPPAQYQESAPAAARTEERASRAPRRALAPATAGAVCVRLCDGFYFPAGSGADGILACERQCPDAPTALYTRPSGSDKIEDAISQTGEKYSALLAAGRHLTSFDNACTCRHALTANRMREMLTDTTLRKGDMVMTPNGMMVFEGSPKGVTEMRDFVPVSRAPNVSKENRAALLAIERAGPADRQTGAYSGKVMAPIPMTPAPRRKGVITIDDGPVSSIK